MEFLVRRLTGCSGPLPVEAPLLHGLADAKDWLATCPLEAMESQEACSACFGDANSRAATRQPGLGRLSRSLPVPLAEAAVQGACHVNVGDLRETRHSIEPMPLAALAEGRPLKAALPNPPSKAAGAPSAKT